MAYDIRRAVPGDEAGIAKVHVDSWRSTYKGLVPDEYLERLSYEQRRNVWTRLLTDDNEAQGIFVAEIPESGIVGFAACGKERSGHPDFTGELYAIYLLREAQGLGIGRALWETAVEQLEAMGHDSMLVWVFAENPSRGFYGRMGGEHVDSHIDTVGGKELEEWAYGWRRLH